MEKKSEKRDAVYYKYKQMDQMLINIEYHTIKESGFGTFDQWQEFLSVVIRCFYYSEPQHEEFHKALERCFKKADIVLKKQSKGWWRSVDTRWESKVGVSTCQIIRESWKDVKTKSAKKYEFLVITPVDFRTVMIFMIASKYFTDWRKKCTNWNASQLPPAIFYGLITIYELSTIKKMFPSLKVPAKASWDSLLTDGILLTSVNTWLKPFCPKTPEKPTLLDEIDVFLQKVEAGEKDYDIDELIDVYEDERRKAYLAAKEPIVPHAFDISLLIFNHAVRIKETFIKSELADDIDLLDLYCKITKCVKSLDIGEGCPELIKTAVSSIDNKILTNKIDNSYSKYILHVLNDRKDGEYSKYTMTTCDVIRVDPVTGEVEMDFQQTKCSPLDVHTSMKYLSFVYPSLFEEFKPMKDGRLNITWDEEIVTLRLTKKQHTALSRILNACVQRTGTPNVTKGVREDWCHVYHLLGARYLYGSNEEMKLSCKMIMKLFMNIRSGDKRDSPTPKMLLNGTETWFRSYLGLLVSIVFNVYESKEYLWLSLVMPFLQADSLDFGYAEETKKRIMNDKKKWKAFLEKMDNGKLKKESEVKGFVQDANNIYRGIESFFHFYTRKTITIQALFVIFSVTQAKNEDWIWDSYSGICWLIEDLYTNFSLDKNENYLGYSTVLLPKFYMDRHKELIPYVLPEEIKRTKIEKAKQLARPDMDSFEQLRRFIDSGGIARLEEDPNYDTEESEDDENDMPLECYTFYALYTLCSDKRLDKSVAKLLFEGIIPHTRGGGKTQKQMRLSKCKGQNGTMTNTAEMYVHELKKTSPNLLWPPVKDGEPQYSCDVEESDEEGENSPDENAKLMKRLLEIPRPNGAPGTKGRENDVKFVNDVDAFLYLLESLETLSGYDLTFSKEKELVKQKNYRGLQLDPPGDWERISRLNNTAISKEPAKCIEELNVPLYYNEEVTPIYSNECIPIWRSRIRDDGTPGMDSEFNLNLFTGCHPDLLSTILIYQFDNLPF